MIRLLSTACAVALASLSVGCQSETKPDRQESVILRIEAEGTATVDGTPSQPAVLPAIEIQVEARIFERERETEALLVVKELDVIGSDRASKEATRLLSKAEQNMPEISYTLVVDKESGAIKSLSVADAKTKVVSQQAQLIDHIQSALRRLIIGRSNDASYQVQASFRDNGIPVTEHQVIGMSQNRFAVQGTRKLDYGDSTNTDEPLPVSPRGIFADSVSVRSYSESSRGFFTRDPGALLPSTLEMSSEAEVTLQLEQAGAANQVKSRSRQRLTIVGPISRAQKR